MDFPASSRVQAQRRRAELLVEAGELSEGLSVLNELLAKTPNVISLQVDSAEILQELAMQSGETADLEAANEGAFGVLDDLGLAAFGNYPSFAQMVGKRNRTPRLSVAQVTIPSIGVSIPLCQENDR